MRADQVYQRGPLLRKRALEPAALPDALSGPQHTNTRTHDTHPRTHALAGCTPPGCPGWQSPARGARVSVSRSTPASCRCPAVAGVVVVGAVVVVGVSRSLWRPWWRRKEVTEAAEAGSRCAQHTSAQSSSSWRWSAYGRTGWFRRLSSRASRLMRNQACWSLILAFSKDLMATVACGANRAPVRSGRPRGG